jgi:hypothetical protein
MAIGFPCFAARPGQCKGCGASPVNPMSAVWEAGSIAVVTRAVYTSPLARDA